MDIEKVELSKEQRFDWLYMDIAKRIALMSRAQRNKVGALLEKDGRIISMGWNGTPSGFDNVCEDENNVTKPEVIHAEMNAILKLAKSHDSGNGSTMYVTLSPCVQCAKAIIQSGIKRVKYDTPYRDLSGVDLLERAGITIEHLMEDSVQFEEIDIQ